MSGGSSPWGYVGPENATGDVAAGGKSDGATRSIGPVAFAAVLELLLDFVR